MSLRVLLGLIVLLLGIPSASSASFDCAKAQTPMEKLICSNPDLSRSDEVMAKAYATALGGLSEAAKKAMQAGQREWLDFAALACTDDAKPVAGSFTEDQGTCINGLFLARIRDLENSKMLGGWRFYIDEHFSVVDDPDPESWNKVATDQSSSPRIDDTVPAAKAFNAFVAKATADFNARASGGEDDAGGGSSADNQLSITVEAVTTRRIGLVANSYWYGHGAAHGNYIITHLHFLTEQARALVASDVFDIQGWQEALGDLVLAELDRTIEGGIWEEARANVPEWSADPTRWSFTDAGLVVQFQPYEVTAYAAGAPTVTIPWDDLRGYLATNVDSDLLY